jgi:hypothetical protein
MNVVSFPETDNNVWCIESLLPSFWQSHIDVVIINFGDYESSRYIEVVYIAPVSPVV